MDQFGQIGPEKGNYAEDVMDVAMALKNGRAVTFALTHRMTRQQVSMALKSRMEVLGHGLGGGPPGTRGGEFVFVAVDEHGAYWFRVDLMVHASTLAEKLSINPVDAETLAEFLEHLGRALGYEPTMATSTICQM